MSTARHITSSDGVRLAVYETGDPDATPIVAAHGYPDNHTVWDGVVAILSARFRVITYDVRGAGESDQPTQRRAYRMAQLVDDFLAVLDAVSPNAPVHLLAHDWGSIAAWPAVTDERLVHRVASFTSISGPSLDYAGAWFRASAKHPRAALRQLLESYYIAFFQLPRVPEALARREQWDRALAAGSRLGRGAMATGRAPHRTEADKINGIQLYRANVLHRLTRPEPKRTDIPVQLLVPDKDIYASPDLQSQSPVPYVSDLSTRRISGGHWVIVDRPDVIARCTSEFIDRVDAGQPHDARASARRRSGRFAGRLVVVTGGGRGIGRACALEFAREGADVIVADVNDTAAKETVTLVQDLGVDATAYHLDVRDADAWEVFAAQVRTEHAVPDVIVNNAGIGMGGPFLDTTVVDWDKVLGVNLWGVIHGCRLFGRQMLERGEGGQIVNIASAAAYSPSKVYPAYATTKAAVLMLSECLRAELASDGIGVTAICPGFVDSDISRTTIFVGADPDEQDRLRAHAGASYSRRGYTPERLAKHAVRAAARNKPLAAISIESKTFRAISRYAPALGRQLAKIDLTKL
jgi:NAD(P)-dependent dehydrogenase (short-subunit alcohol dehydrogenase family)/pimeloyl-ACP methyl ester carboxylesterase